VTFDGAQSLDVAGPLETFAIAAAITAERTPRAPRAYHVEVLAARPGPVRMNSGLRLVADRVYGRVQGGIDTLVVSGGDVAAAARDVVLRRWLVRMAGRVRRLASVCSGSFILAEAGLLDGRRATTHWMFLNELRARYPAVDVVDEGIFVKDGRAWTSAGITTGIDLMLSMVEDDHGHRVAMAVARRLVLFLRRSGNQAQFSAALQRQEKEPPRLRDISTFVLEHIDEPMLVERIARRTGMSARTLSRWCREHLGESPAALVRRLRVDEARRLLEETSLPLKDITARTGLGDASTLWRVFTQRLGVTPAAYRQRFAAAA